MSGMLYYFTMKAAFQAADAKAKARRDKEAELMAAVEAAKVKLAAGEKVRLQHTSPEVEMIVELLRADVTNAETKLAAFIAN